MLVYVQNSEGQPLMPCKPSKARKLLKSGQATVAQMEPFTIKLKYKTSTYIQPITLGVDAGSKTIGLSATTESKELFAANVILRNDIVDLLSTRREARRTRRNRLRHRAPRFLNRGGDQKGWLAPSVNQKIETHLHVVEKLHKILPIKNIIVETAAFDTQKLKNPEISGKGYQEGEQMDFWNVREYVLFRDNHTCQACKGKSKDPILNVHHLESRKTGGNSPGNLITLCETCHHAYHQGKIKLSVKRAPSYRDAAFMGIMRWGFYEKLKSRYHNVSMTFGYITKNTRITNKLPKDHYVDARCISGNPTAKPLDKYAVMSKKRCQDRKIYRQYKGRPPVLSGWHKYSLGMYDKDVVIYEGKKYIVTARNNSNKTVCLMTLGGEMLKGSTGKSNKMVSVKKVKLLYHSRGSFSYLFKTQDASRKED